MAENTWLPYIMTMKLGQAETEELWREREAPPGREKAPAVRDKFDCAARGTIWLCTLALSGGK
jgi:hypothetical protein